MKIEEKKLDGLENISPKEIRDREDILRLFNSCPIPEKELLRNLSLFINRQTFSRYIFFQEIYQKILNVHGVVMEFGVRWGQNLALFSTLRGIYEPYNYTRKLIGFDTFSGFPSVSEKDGNADVIRVGELKVSEQYEVYLEKILAYHQSESPLSHINKFEIVKGDAAHTLEAYLKKNPETIVAFAYLDMDLYEPTKNVLSLIKDHVTKGSIIGFDELNYPAFPGETLALKEVFGLSKFSIKRSTLTPMSSYIVIE